MDGPDKFINSGRPIGEIFDMVIQINREKNLIWEPYSWHRSQFDLMRLAKYVAQLYVFLWFATPSIASNISNFTSDGRPEIVRHMEIISVVHFTEGDSIELICSPFEFFPLWDDPVKFSNSVGFLDPTRTGSPFRGMPVMKLISLALIVIG